MTTREETWFYWAMYAKIIVVLMVVVPRVAELVQAADL